MFSFGDAVEGVPPLTHDVPFPVVVFSHGNQGINFQSVFFTEHLASHGYVVVAPNHPYNTFADADDSHGLEIAVWRPRDTSAALDRVLEAGADPGDPLYGKVDGTRTAVSGHSYGGFTTAAAMGWEFSTLFGAPEDDLAELGVTLPADLGDPRFLAGVAMTPCGPSFAGTDGIDQINGPTLYFAGDRDGICPVQGEVEPLWSHSPSPTWLALVEDAGHYGFSNYCDFLPEDDECDPPYRDPAEIQAIANGLSTDFLGLYLREDERYGGVIGDVGAHFTGVEMDAATE